MRLAVAVAIAVSLIDASAPSSSSQTARQGPVATRERFRSPMIVEAPLSSVEEMYVPLAEKARKAGADAVINVHLWHAASGFAWAAPHAGGMAVKWTEAGRKALHGFPGRCY